ncbi:MAG: GntR family transcriptional regulator, partial [Candidatus Saccharibacteria bacterium]|nr:GntR family transcriptional regulator [Candidatus Saccharibacteria bacterium]
MKKRLSDVVIRKVRDYIEDNSLKVGDRLPTEQEMTELFGVSRIIVREANKALDFIGVIKATTGTGLTVGPVDMERISEILGFHFLIDDYPRELLLKTRMVLEIGSLQYAMAAISADKKIFDTLIALCDKLDQTNDPQEFIRGDSEFHRTLVETGGIDPLLAFSDVVSAFFLKFRSEIIGGTEAERRNGSKVHRKIVNALHQCDIIAAEN